jgi:hypothetical protein
VRVTNRYYPTSNFPLDANGTTYNLAGLGALRNTWYEYLQIPAYTGGSLNYPTIKDMSLYVNNIFTHPAIHDIYIKRIGFFLVRVHRR